MTAPTPAELVERVRKANSMLRRAAEATRSSTADPMYDSALQLADESDTALTDLAARLEELVERDRLLTAHEREQRHRAERAEARAAEAEEELESVEARVQEQYAEVARLTPPSIVRDQMPALLIVARAEVARLRERDDWLAKQLDGLIEDAEAHFRSIGSGMEVSGGEAQSARAFLANLRDARAALQDSAPSPTTGVTGADSWALVAEANRKALEAAERRVEELEAALRDITTLSDTSARVASDAQAIARAALQDSAPSPTLSAVSALESRDAALYRIAKSRYAHGNARVISMVELARQMEISRSTLYDRLARIEKELKPRFCACGCGQVLPPKSTRRRRYLTNSHGATTRRAGRRPGGRLGSPEATGEPRR